MKIANKRELCRQLRDSRKGDTTQASFCINLDTTRENRKKATIPRRVQGIDSYNSQLKHIGFVVLELSAFSRLVL